MLYTVTSVLQIKTKKYFSQYATIKYQVIINHIMSIKNTEIFEITVFEIEIEKRLQD